MTIHIILLSGRSGVGKTSVANEMHEQLGTRNVRHAHIDGDNLDMIYPEEDGPALFLRNLAPLLENYYRLRGCNRFIISGTAMVLERDGIERVIEDVFRGLPGQRKGGEDLEIKGFILTADDEVVIQRLQKREVGSILSDGYVILATNQAILWKLDKVL